MQCQICGKELGCLNSNHTKTHGLTLEEYYEKYPDFKPVKRRSGAKAVTKALDKPKKKAVSTQVTKSIDDLYVLNEQIQIPSVFTRIMEDNVEDLDNMINRILACKEMDLDTETTGLDPYNDIVTDISITVHDGTYLHNYHIPFLHIKREYQYMTHDDVLPSLKAFEAACDVNWSMLNPEPSMTWIKEGEILVPGQLTKSYVFTKLRPILESENIHKNMFNDYFDDPMIDNCHIKLRGVTFDGLIAGKLLDENEPSHKLKDLYHKYLYDKETNLEVKALGVETFEEQFGKLQFYRVPMNVATAYAAKDTYMTGKLKDFQKHYIDTIQGIDNVFYNIEMPLLPVLIQMRKTGIYADRDYAHGLESVMRAKQEDYENKLHDLLGNINLNSPKQLAKALFEDMKLPDMGKGSTKATILQELADQGYEVAEILLDYKKSEKLISTYLAGVDNIIKPTGRVHCRFNQNGTVTGRLSSSDPNLQNIPSKNHEIRKMFRSQEPGWCIISCDWSQVEPRLLAHISGDPNMIQAYKDGIDIYAMLGAKVFTRIAENFTDKLTASNTDLEGVAHYASPLYKYILDNQFVWLDHQEPGDNFSSYQPYNIWAFREIKITDCFDGSLFRKQMKTLLLGKHLAA